MEDLGNHETALEYALTLTSDADDMCDFLNSWSDGVIETWHRAKYAAFIRDYRLRDGETTQ